MALPAPQCPIITCVQKIVVYETKARYYIVGSNNTETAFRVLKIDRTEAKHLHIVDDQVEYSPREIRDLLLMIDVGNRPKQQTKGSLGLSRTLSAFGLVGFVQFLEGYYMILITKRRKVAQVGPHTLYKIEDTNMIYIPNDTVRFLHPDEQKYVKLFQTMDLSSNFYFSYSYDLTRTIQYHLTPSCEISPKIVQSASKKHVKVKGEDMLDTSPVSDKKEPVRSCDTDSQDDISIFCQDLKIKRKSHSSGENKTNARKSAMQSNHKKAGSADVESANFSLEDKTDSKGFPARNVKHKERVASSSLPSFQGSGHSGSSSKGVGIKTEPSWQYVWNLHLLRDVQETLHPDWLLYVTHGFLGQSNIQVFGKSVYLTLIARRSNKFAGTRFLKRGANIDGQVANEVETEQIVHDACVSDLRKARVTSYVQLRGSLPMSWAQDITKMMPKPTIYIDQADPYCHLAGQHFNRVMKRYGSPVIILNLVKKREKKRHESTLTDELLGVIRYLNQFLPAEHIIRYIGFDMAKVSKSKNCNVLERLATIAEYCVKKTGIFLTGQGLHCNKIRPHPSAKGLDGLPFELGTKQRGVTRTNCVDCLDRTNTAQFALGKCALAFQLYTLGIIHTPNLEFETDCVRMLEELYEDQGDTLALQYGGSQLVHRIKGYRNVAHWTSSSKDIMQTVSRYYNNAFSDTDKQHAMNLFLGVYTPKDGTPNVWDLTTDFYLHNILASAGPLPRDKSYSQWWEQDVFKSLPYSSEEINKGKTGTLILLKTNRYDERINEFWDYYRPYEMTSLNDHYTMHMINSVRDFMPKFVSNFSPFALRIQPGRRHEEYGTKSTEVNPNVCGKESASSVLSTGSDSSSSEDESGDIEGDLESYSSGRTTPESMDTYVSFKDLFPTMEQTYGVEILEPGSKDVTMYKRYAQIGHNATRHLEHTPSIPSRYSTELIQQSVFPLDSSYSVEPPTVSPRSKEVYETYLSRGKKGASEPTKWDRKVYQKYFKTKYL